MKDPAALNVVVGVNDHLFDASRHRLLTAASCTTNCLAPVVKVLHEAIGIRHGQITTIHDPTNTNVVTDAPHKDLRRARSAMLSLSPTTTGSATAIALIYPELKGKLNGHAVRAPVLNASLTDCVFEMKRPVTEIEINALFQSAAVGPLAGILGFEMRPLVSADYVNDTRSAIVDGPSTMVTDETLLKVYAWYDNEVGYACRMVDLANIVTREEPLMSAVRNYAVVTASYWSFTLTDGALRMLVLLHFYGLGYTPFMLAFLFLLYEAAGIFANLGGGWLAARFGIPRMLMTGLILQIAGLVMLSALQTRWAPALSVAWVVAAQGVAGVAKDLTKTASKSAIKATSEGGAGQLFRWVAWFTGSKNAMKGVGFFVGGLLLELAGFRGALWMMAGLLAFVLVCVSLSLPRTLGKAKASKSFRELFAKTRSINLLAGASHLHVRLARCVVRRRAAGVSLRAGLALYAGGGISGGLDDWLWPRSSTRAKRHSPQPRRALTRSARGRTMGRRAHRYSGRTCAPGHEPSADPPRSRGGYRPRHFRLCVRRRLVAAFLSHPRLCGLSEGGGGCRFLLRGQRRWPAYGNFALWRTHAGRRDRGMSLGLGRHAGALSRAHIPAAHDDHHAARARYRTYRATGTSRLIGRGSSRDAGSKNNARNDTAMIEPESSRA